MDDNTQGRTPVVCWRPCVFVSREVVRANLVLCNAKEAFESGRLRLRIYGRILRRSTF